MLPLSTRLKTMVTVYLALSLALLSQSASASGYVFGETDDHNHIHLLETELKDTIVKLGDHAETAEAWNKLGWAWLEVEGFSKSIQSHTDALRIHQHLYGEFDLEVARDHNYIGVVFHSNADYEVALRHYQIVAELYQKNLNHEDFDTADIAINWRNMTRVLLKMERHQEALTYAQKALLEDSKGHIDDKPILAGSHMDLGRVYLTMQNYQNALEHFEKAILLEEESQVGSDSILTARHRVVLADTHAYLGQKRAAKSNYERAIRSFLNNKDATLHDEIKTVAEKMASLNSSDPEHQH